MRFLARLSGLSLVVLSLAVAPQVAQAQLGSGDSSTERPESLLDLSSRWVQSQPPRSLLDISSAFLQTPSATSAQPVGVVTRLVLRLNERRVYAYSGDQVKISYPVAIGREGWKTPTGNFRVMSMIEHPAWQNPFTGVVIPPGPDNPLGERWIGFWTNGQNWVGFHGTPQPELVGQAVSHGCVRMVNQDIVALFAQVQVDTPVSVVP